MKLPLKTQEPVKPTTITIEEIDAFGGAYSRGHTYVKECRKGEIVKKSETIPWKRGVVNKKVVFYYLKKGEVPPSADQLIPSIW